MNAKMMNCRAAAHDYTQTGVYHITMRVADGIRQPLGRLVGDVTAADGSPDAPRTELSAIGRMVEEELLHSIRGHYAMVSVDAYVVMPDHLHFILEVHDKIISRNGKTVPLGQVLAGFKKGCNKRFWAITGETAAAGSGQTAAHTGTAAAGLPGGTSSSGTAAAGFPGGTSSGTSGPVRPYKVPSNGTTGRQPLFSHGYCDVMPVDAAQLATQRQYIKDNPRYRLIRRGDRERLSTHRRAIITALTTRALRGYLRHECQPWQATDEKLAAIEERLLVDPSGPTAAPTGSNDRSGQTAAHTGTAASNGGSGPTAVPTGTAAAGLPGGTAPATTPAARVFIACDCYGERGLLQRQLLPVVCHRRDAARFSEQKARCLEAAAAGAVLVSPRIAKGEQAIIDEAIARSLPVVLIADNGFPPVYHPSTARTDLCRAGRLLLVTPWQYRYCGKNEQVSVPFCKTMNCVAQALCRTDANWWQNL